MANQNESVFQHFYKLIFKGLLWLLPMVAVTMVVIWLYTKIDHLVESLLHFIGLEPQKNEFLWFLGVIGLFLLLLYIIGHLVETRMANLFEKLFCRIPGYSTLRDIFGIFSASKDGKTKVLVVAIRGFGASGYNIGLMYSQKESILKDYYTVTLSMSPIPNGGFMFELHKNDIFVIEEATFDDNLQYLLSMGVKSMAEVLKRDPQPIDTLMSLSNWLEKSQKHV